MIYLLLKCRRYPAFTGFNIPVNMIIVKNIILYLLCLTDKEKDYESIWGKWCHNIKIEPII
jgi:hypothetical protein